MANSGRCCIEDCGEPEDSWIHNEGIAYPFAHPFQPEPISGEASPVPLDSAVRDSWLAGGASTGEQPPVAVILEGNFGRYEVAKYLYPRVRWSGSRWVEIGGEVQISNFA